MKRWALLAGLSLGWGALAVGLGGCGEALVGMGATVGVAAAQERSVGDAVDDAAILANVNHHLLQKSQHLFANVDVEVLEGRVLLTGNVRQPDDRVEAARLAWRTNGVREVLNEVGVRDRTSLKDYATDTWITTQLKARLLRDTGVSAINYTVETVNGVVYLLGIAQSQEELDRVTGHARNIKSVTKVVSHVVLKDDPKRRS
ncbi:MAG: BON domain-containing protein [Alphaproteobacteria bacterium]|nr:BON domain-containing protein [Alphaproteobacteria bacterium]MDP6815965.1 BON domain-containing protein [Alphaproteobacteria bacterium]